ncbi:hypothetical protein [Nitrosomonas sp.]|uniref:hypothetical protein n=1 Tax=Nitrosomonas sp. TaxID=42353 RepID=UPI00272FCD26|nr:hypothetical protein [Nitrosomonas sp.]MDP2225624.1 hypothetical protein [Nitrosomonas sp.]
MMAQNRKAPAYQEYAATILAQIPFRTMTLQDRGLLYTMRLECWVNMYLPNNHIDLAKVLGVPVAEVMASLPTVMPFFEIAGDFIICPELEDYRTHLTDRKFKQSEGGKNGSAITNSKRSRNAKVRDEDSSSTPSSNLSTNSTTTPQVPCQGELESSVQSNTEKPNQTQSIKKAVIDDPFVRDYEAAEQCTADDYAKVSKGY